MPYLATETCVREGNDASSSKHAEVGDMDDLELQTAGYTREMPRQFSTFSLMSLSFALTCTWSGTGSSMGISLTEAGSAGTIWALVPAAVMTAIVSAGMAELASAYPVAGAQYYWSFMVSSEKHRAFASYLNGWMSILGWWLASASVANFVSSMILSMAVLWYPDYTIQHYQQWLVFVALIWLALFLNVFLSWLIPAFNKLILVLACFSLTATTITLLICSRNNFPPANYIFGDATNSTGWKTDGLAFVLCITNALYAFLGTDCGAHMCEEIHNPSKNVPKVIMYPIGMGFITAWPYAVACMAGITDLKAVLNTATGLPLIEIYYQGTGGSQVGATVLMALFAFCFFGCLVANATTCSRTLWAVSRDGALPWSNMWMQVHPRFKVPVNALSLSAILISVYGLIFLGSTAIFSSMVGAAIVFLQTSCVIPQAILLYRGRDRVLPERYFNLGRLGPAINGISVAWIVFVDVIYCLPTAIPVTKENMNWISVVSAGLVSFVIGLWFIGGKRRTFKGPSVNFDMMNFRRQEALSGAVSDLSKVVEIAEDENKPLKLGRSIDKVADW